MNQLFQTIEQSLVIQPNLEHRSRQQLIRLFWLLTLGLLLFELFSTQASSLVSNFGAILITIGALLPSYLWCSGRAQGIPIFPVFAITFVWTHALPLVNGSRQILSYSPEQQLFGSATVAGFLALGTLIWFQFVKSVSPLPKYYRALSNQKGDVFFLSIMVLAVFFNISNNAGWRFLEGGIFTAVRSTILGLTVLACFVLAYQLGTKALSKKKSRLFLILLILYMITDAVSLLLVGAASTFFVATVAFIIGRKRVPILPIVIFLICISFLHYGKGEMRGKYWFGTKSISVQPWEYPAWYSEWTGYTLDYLSKQENLSKTQKKESFLERSSVIQMLLLAQNKSPEFIPFLNGETYAIVPQLLIPRIFDSNKIRSNEGTAILSIHYGLQTRKQTFITTIGWSLLAEAYANFGMIGSAGLGIILGVVYGKATRWSINAPILSSQSLFAVLMLAFALQSEWTAGVYIAALFQSSIVLVGITIILMKKYPSQRFPLLSKSVGISRNV